MWQCRAALPSHLRGSNSLDRRPQPAKRLPQVLVLDVRQAFGDARGRSRIRLWDRRTLATPQWGLPERNAPDGLPTEETIDPFEDDGGQMLDLERRGAFDPEHQRGGIRCFLSCDAWSGDLEGLAVSGNFSSDDIRPAGNDLG